MSYKFFIASLFALFYVSSCTLEPKYKTPESPVTLEKSENTPTLNLTDFFQNKELHNVIALALMNNRDLQLAAINIETAIQTYNIKRADLLPTVGITALDVAQGAPPAFAAFTPANTYRANITLASYEMDFFGRLRSLKKAAKQSYFATTEARNLVQSSLVAQTATAYLQLIADKDSLEITKAGVREQSTKLALLKQRRENGRASNVDVLAEEITLETMKASENSYQKLIDQDLHILMLLTGVFEEEKLKPYFEKVHIDSIAINTKSITGIPSEILLTRPDIKQAELKLMAANANIGAARAAFFPAITLTGNFGYTSRDFSALFSSQSWSYTPQVYLPIFAGGRNKANLTIAELQKKTEIANYEKAIQTAFREFLDAASNYKASNMQVENYKTIVKMNQNMEGLLANQRSNGITDSIILANASIKTLSAKQALVAQKRENFANMIAMYKALGGGVN